MRAPKLPLQVDYVPMLNRQHCMIGQRSARSRRRTGTCLQAVCVVRWVSQLLLLVAFSLLMRAVLANDANDENEESHAAPEDDTARNVAGVNEAIALVHVGVPLRKTGARVVVCTVACMAM